MAKKSKGKTPRKRGAPKKQRDFKQEYERRIKNATAKGKSRQAARGHKAGEHIERAEREMAERGITAAQEKTVRGWYERDYNPRGFPDQARADLDDLLEYARSEGYDAFRGFRAVWDLARRTYIAELLDGSYASRGQAYLQYLTQQAGVEDVSWLYYH